MTAKILLFCPRFALAGLAAVAAFGAAGVSADPRAELAAAKSAIMAADYRADLAGLERERDQVAGLARDSGSAYLAHYWSGFASWRIALNGAGKAMPALDQRRHLEAASAAFEASLAARGDFADSLAARASVLSWLGTFYRQDQAKVKELWQEHLRLLGAAKKLEPDNPRVLWVEAADHLFLPVEFGGDPERKRALELYRRMLELDRPLEPASPLPDWGRPEALMSLAFTYLNLGQPDTAAAEREARAALALRPEWYYVREVLLPQIAAARAARAPG